VRSMWCEQYLRKVKSCMRVIGSLGAEVRGAIVWQCGPVRFLGQQLSKLRDGCDCFSRNHLNHSL
jgi:hypothetical protein